MDLELHPFNKLLALADGYRDVRRGGVDGVEGLGHGGAEGRRVGEIEPVETEGGSPPARLLGSRTRC